MATDGPIAVTGARGRLGKELLALHPEWMPLNRPEFDLTDPQRIRERLDRVTPSLILHAAAHTDVAGAERDRADCWAVNVQGTLHLVREALRRDLPMVYISTDYVFEGTTGGYREEDTPGPTRNYYALTKLAAEGIVRALPRFLILRTSFRPREWPYPVAFADLYTSQDYVDVIAPEIALAVERFDEIPYDTLHIATERKSVYDLARRRKPDVQPGSRLDAKVALPEDISLDCTRWNELKSQWGVR